MDTIQGHQYSYSNAGIELLDSVLEKVYHKKFEVILTEYLAQFSVLMFLNFLIPPMFTTVVMRLILIKKNIHYQKKIIRKYWNWNQRIKMQKKCFF